MNRKHLTISIPTPSSTDDLDRLSIELGSQLTTAGFSFVISYSHDDIGVNTLIGGHDRDIPPLILEVRKRAVQSDPFYTEIELPKELERPEAWDPFEAYEQEKKKLSREVTACLTLCKMVGLNSPVDPHDFTTQYVYVAALESQDINYSDLEQAVPAIAALERFPTPYDLIQAATPHKRRRQNTKYIL